MKTIKFKLMKKVIVCLLLGVTFSGFSQVGFGNQDPKATFHITGEPTVSTKADGLLLPKLTGNQLKDKDGVYGADQIGTVVYVTAPVTVLSTKTANVSAAGYYYFDGNVWQKLNSSANSDKIINVVHTLESSIPPGLILYLRPGQVVGGPWFAYPIDMMTAAEAAESPIVGYSGGNSDIGPYEKFDFIRFNSEATLLGVMGTYAAEKTIWYRPLEDVKWADNPGTLGNAVRIGYSSDALGNSLERKIRFDPKWASETIFQPITTPTYKPVLSKGISSGGLNYNIGRYIVAATGCTGVLVGRENNFADFDGTNFTFTVPDVGTFAQIMDGNLIGAIYNWNGTSWVLYGKSTPLGIDNNNESKDYSSGDLVIKNNKLYQANNDIVRNTPFAVGITGATWKLISDLSNWNLATNYETGDVVKLNGVFYEANASIPSNTAFVIGTTGATWKQIGTMSRITTVQRTTLGTALTTAADSNNKGVQVYDTDTNSIWFWNGTTWNEVADKSNLSTNNYVSANAYKANDLVIRNNKIYQANGAIVANTAFAIGTTGATWKKISAIPEWVLTDVYETGDLVKKDGNLYEANANIPTGTAFITGTTGATWKTLIGAAEFNFVFPTNSSSTSSATVADLPGATLNLPSAGVYRVYYNMSTIGSQDGGNCSFYITNSSNSVYNGSSSTSIKIYGGSASSMATQEITITVNAPTTIKVRWGTNGSGTSTLVNSTISSSVFGYEKIAGFLPLTTGITGTNGVPNWLDGGAITIGATTTAPTKPTTTVADKIYYKQIGPKTWEVEGVISWDNNTGASNGTGDYLISLPNGLQFDQSILTQASYTGNVGANSYFHLVKGIPNSRVVAFSSPTYNASQPSMISPYDATRFRVILYIQGIGIYPWGSGWLQLASQTSMELRFNFTFQSAN